MTNQRPAHHFRPRSYAKYYTPQAVRLIAHYLGEP